MLIKKHLITRPAAPGAGAPAAPRAKARPVLHSLKARAQAKGGAQAAAPKAAAQAPAPQSALVELKQRAELAEKVKDYLLSSLASGVRTPMVSLVEAARQLGEGEVEESQRADVALAIAAEGWAIVQMLDDVLDLVELNGGAVAPVDVISLVTETVDRHRGEAAAKGLTLSCEIGDIPSLVFNGHRLRIVLNALLENSIKFTTEGRIGVTVSYFGGRFKLTVEDTGCGIPLAEQQRFAEQGLGGGAKRGVLPSGLAVIEHLAVSMNGDISLQSTPGLGTVISIVFTGVQPEAGAVARRLSSMQRISLMKTQDRLPWKANFLLVDRSPIQRAAIEGMLRKIGFENISGVGSGSEALMRLMSGAVDIVLTGFDLPQMNGATLATEIRRIEAFKRLPVYVLTADESVVSRYAEMGFDGYLLKPITAEKLHRILG